MALPREFPGRALVFTYQHRVLVGNSQLPGQPVHVNTGNLFIDLPLRGRLNSLQTAFVGPGIVIPVFDEIVRLSGWHELLVDLYEGFR